MKTISNGELCMLRNFLSEVYDGRMLPGDMIETLDEMLRIVEHTLTKEDINTPFQLTSEVDGQ